MHSIKEIFVIGNGPSSSHTIGPSRAANYILEKYPDIKECNVTLYGSLAFTGKGHLTDKIITDIFNFKNIKSQIIFNYKENIDLPNMMLFDVVLTNGNTKQETIYSIGGGSIYIKGEDYAEEDNIYPLDKMEDIKQFCISHQISLFDYVIHYEGKSIVDFFKNVLKTMDAAVERGLNTEGYLPGPLKVIRKAKKMNDNREFSLLGESDVAMNVAVHAFAVAEENAAGGVVVTAPTCGSAGVIPGIIKYLRMKNVNDTTLIAGLCVAGLFGMICKTNATVSGAQGGCQAEIGVACAMGAAMIAFCFGKDTKTIVQSAEIALEHSLGLTCDPVDGYVQIPCIERCAIFAIKAINAVKLASIIPCESSHVNFDQSVETMYITGKDMNIKYRETAVGGLAKIIKNPTK